MEQAEVSGTSTPISENYLIPLAVYEGWCQRGLPRHAVLEDTVVNFLSIR